MKTKLKYCLMAVVAIIALCSFRWSHREGDEIPGNQQIETIYYRGHSYVCYRFYKKSQWKDESYGYGGASIIHDPDCTKCKKGGDK
ncbi:MAG: hypothetical protein HDS83_03135 [Bacteroidales bacterium]|nr:hypothetical protein [Bacteroidales bacterium]